MTGKNIFILGEIDADINFTYSQYNSPTDSRAVTTRTVGSCATTLNDEMYVFGGQLVYRQVNF